MKADRINVSKIQIFYAVCTLFLMVFIFRNSAMVADDSSAMSGRLLHLMRDVMGLPVTSFIVRKTAHFIEFAALGLCMLGTSGYGKVRDKSDFVDNEFVVENDIRTLNKDSARLRNLKSLVSIAAGWFYAATDEFHQMFVEGRSCELRDWCIDALGVAAGVLFMILLYRCMNSKTE